MAAPFPYPYPDSKAYRVCTGFCAGKAITAADLVRFEIHELGNKASHYIHKKYWALLERISVCDVYWVCQKEEDCLRYSEENGVERPECIDELNIPFGSQVIAEDNEGGYLVLSKPLFNGLGEGKFQ